MEERLNYKFYGRSRSIEPCMFCNSLGADDFLLMCETCDMGFDVTCCSKCFLTGPEKPIMRKHIQDNMHCAVDLI